MKMIDPNEFPWSQIISVIFAILLFYTIERIKKIRRFPEIIIIRPTILEKFKFSLKKSSELTNVYLKNVGDFPSGFWFTMKNTSETGSILDIRRYTEHETGGPLDKEEIRAFHINTPVNSNLLNVHLVYFSKKIKREGVKLRYQEYPKIIKKDYPIGAFSPRPDVIIEGDDRVIR